MKDRDRETARAVLTCLSSGRILGCAMRSFMNVRSLVAIASLAASMALPSLAGAQVQVRAGIRIGTPPPPTVVVQPAPQVVVVQQPAQRVVVVQPVYRRRGHHWRHHH
jgi:hypothetical protein